MKTCFKHLRVMPCITHMTPFMYMGHDDMIGVAGVSDACFKRVYTLLCIYICIHVWYGTHLICGLESV